LSTRKFIDEKQSVLLKRPHKKVIMNYIKNFIIV